MIHEKNLEVRSYYVCVCTFLSQLCDQELEPGPEPEPAPKPKKENKKGKIVKKDKPAAGKKKKKKVSLCRFDCRLCRCGVLLNFVLYSRTLQTLATTLLTL